MKNSNAAIEPRAEGPADEPTMRTPDEWATQKGTLAWAFSGAKQALRDHWVIGRVVSEADFDKAIARVVSMPFGSPARLVKPRIKRGRA